MQDPVVLFCLLFLSLTSLPLSADNHCDIFKVNIFIVAQSEKAGLLAVKFQVSH